MPAMGEYHESRDRLCVSFENGTRREEYDIWEPEKGRSSYSTPAETSVALVPVFRLPAGLVHGLEICHSSTVETQIRDVRSEFS